MGGALKRAGPDTSWTVRRYLDESSSLGNAALLTAPIVLSYEVGLLLVGESGVRNAADALIDQGLMAFGRPVALAANLVVLFVFVGFALASGTRKATPIGLFVPVVAESAAYACVMGPALAILYRAMLSASTAGPLGPAEGVVLSFGAGFYEELVFRLAAVGGVLALVERFGKRPNGVVVVVVLVVTSVIFSWFHHVGPGAEPFAARNFVARMVAGLMLGALYILRGFGVTCYTHVIYDVFCLVRI